MNLILQKINNNKNIYKNMLNNIERKIVLKKIFSFLQKKMPFKILKYNKKLIDKLNLEKEFNDFKIIKELNINYRRCLFCPGDSDAFVFDFRKSQTGNKIFNYLSKIQFNELINLNISENEITDIEELKNCNFRNLEILDLGGNKISDINILSKVKYYKLKHLNLKYNAISNINILEKVLFLNLEQLILNYNQISDINILERVNFPKLKYQSLH